MTTLEDVIVQLQTNSDNTVAATEASTESIVGSFQSNFTTLIDTIKGDSLDKLEATREAGRAARQGAPGAGGLLAGAGAGAGGLLGGLGGFGAGAGILAGGLGVGGGALLAGAGVGLAGLAALLLSIDNLDGKKIRANVNEILGIAEDASLIDTGIVFTTLTALGTGLAVFGVGSTITGLGDALTNFTNENWAQSVKSNVATLLSITDINFGDVAAVSTALTALGGGLAIFGVGSTLGGLSDALNNFTNKDWAESVKNNVATLLSMEDINFGDAGKASAALRILGTGLAIFGLGGGIAGLSDALTNFTNANWASNIVSNVETLLSISDISLGDTGKFVATMTGLSAGLTVFSFGQLGSQAVQALEFFRTDGFAQTIKDNVVTLLSINELADEGQALKFLGAMTSMSAGLALFSSAQVFSGLASSATNILNFLSGNKSPVEQVRKLAESADDIEKASDGLQSMSDALTRFAAIDFNVKDADFTGLTRNIQKAVPLIQSLATGESKLLGKDIPSIFDPSLRLDEMVVEIGKIRAILGASVEISTVAPNQVSIPADQLNATQNRTIQAQAANVSNNVITDASVNTQSTNTVVNDFSQTPNVYNDRMALMLGTASGR
jgi:hypothetical protein